MSRRHLAVVASHPIQYQAPWFRALAREVDLQVYFCHRQDAHGQAAAGYQAAFEWDVPLLEGFEHRFLRNVSTQPNVFSYGGCDTPEIAELLARGHFDACVVCGWYLKSYLQTIRACRRQGIGLLLRGDSHLGTRRSVITSAIKWLPYRVLLNRVDGHLYVGKANKAYLRHYGVPEGKLFFTPHFVNNAFFASGAERASAEGSAAAFRRALGIPHDAVVAVFVGRLVPGKRIDDLVRAIAIRRRASCLDLRALIVGSGPSADDLQRLSTDLDAPVHFAGFRNQSELAIAYAASDLLVLPSDSETWGLTVNEAMACGLPAVVSSAVGCRADLIREGVTGRSFPVGDSEALADALARTADDLRADRPAVRLAVRTLIAAYSCPVAVAATIDAVETVVGCERIRQHPADPPRSSSVADPT